MIINLYQQQAQKFQQLAEKIIAQPALYLAFDSVADFYAASYLAEFPKGSRYFATGSDDGAEQFYARIEYVTPSQVYFLNITKTEQTTAQFGVMSR